MPGEDNFDSILPQSIKLDRDSPDFRNKSLPRVTTLLQEQLAGYKVVLQAKNLLQMQSVLAESSDRINRAVVGVEAPQNIYSSPETAILHALGMVIWEKPKDTGRLEREILKDLATQFASGQIDIERLAKGVYFLEILLHKYENGNGRTARAMKLLVEKAGTNGGVGENDTRQVLGVDRQSLTQTGEHTFQINFNPDFERLVLGVAYFALDKGLPQDEIEERLKLNGTLPEQGLDVLSRRLGVQKTQLKDEFVHFMAVKSDLSWCNFEASR